MPSSSLWLWIGLGIALVGLIVAAIEISVGVLRSMRAERAEWRTKAFCPGCKSDLVSNGYFVGETERGLVVYECRACKVESFWDFDPPLPILIKPVTREDKDAS